MLLDKINYPEDLRKLSIAELPQLAAEVREFIIETISKIGGHLGANLGVVELTIALHYVFDTPNDKLIWDIGHQAYPHKILTGRKNLLKTIRQKDGISGFCKITESEYDCFGAGHSSTSLSAGLGIDIAQKILRDIDESDNKLPKKNVISIIGDGAMSAGMAFEALNNIGFFKNNMITILNDNNMSIAKSTGALKKYFNDLIISKEYSGFKKITARCLKRFPFFKDSLHRVKEAMKSFLGYNSLFNQLGLKYSGPLDGHDLPVLIKTFRKLKGFSSNKPIVLHIITKKGKGYKPAELSTDKLHGVSKFDIKTGAQKKSSDSMVSFSKIFASSLCEFAKENKKIVAITAAMPDGTCLNLFEKAFPDRYFDVGIAEQHAVTFAAGLATQGVMPFVVLYSTFMQRAYDQILHDVAIQNLPVKFAIDRAGLVPQDGPTHYGSFDIAFLINLPNFVVMAASSQIELIRMIKTAELHNSSPIAFRYPKRSLKKEDIDMGDIKAIEIGKSKIILEGSKIAIVAFGFIVQTALEAAKIYEETNSKITVVNARFAKPLDEKMLLNLLDGHNVIITIEEGASYGFGAAVLNFYSENNLLGNIKVKNIGIPDRWIEQGDLTEVYEDAGLDKSAILEVLQNFSKK